MLRVKTSIQVYPLPVRNGRIARTSGIDVHEVESSQPAAEGENRTLHTLYDGGGSGAAS
jgi:hypothetical protein